MSAIETTTDMAAFQGALDDNWCHCYSDTPGVALCGASYDVRKPSHLGSIDTVICSGCGRRNCPDCWSRT